MSFSRENITWQSKDGGWSIGFYETLWVGSESDGLDPEWDVEYGSEFSWVSTGHRDPSAARRAWTGANPGGGIIIEQYDAAESAALDQAAERCKVKMREDARADRMYSRRPY